jgi:peptide chain release factor subunit 1
MITRPQIDQLLAFKNGEHLITSCYLNLDRSKMPAQMLKIRTKDLLQQAHHDLTSKTASHVQRESLRGDFEEIEAFVMAEIVANRYKAVALFSCAGEKFWQAFGLPRIVRNILVADHDPYIRPLMAILSEYHRYCTVTVDRVTGEILEVYMGEIVERSTITDEIPRRVREAGFGGRNERAIQRRYEHAVHRHFQRLADATFALFKRDYFDWLVLGGHREVLREFKTHLHPYLKRRWAGDFHADPATVSPPEVLKHTLEIEERVESQHEQRLVEELTQKAEAGERAVRGISPTLSALARGEAQTLLVEEGFETPGYSCFACHYVSLEPQDCPNCHKPLEPCNDIIDEAIELAILKNCHIEHVQGPTALRDGGRMGALLRFQTL